MYIQLADRVEEIYSNEGDSRKAIKFMQMTEECDDLYAMIAILGTDELY